MRIREIQVDFRIIVAKEERAQEPRTVSPGSNPFDRERYDRISDICTGAGIGVNGSGIVEAVQALADRLKQADSQATSNDPDSAALDGWVRGIAGITKEMSREVASIPVAREELRSKLWVLCTHSVYVAEAAKKAIAIIDREKVTRADPPGHGHRGFGGAGPDDPPVVGNTVESLAIDYLCALSERDKVIEASDSGAIEGVSARLELAGRKLADRIGPGNAIVRGMHVLCSVPVDGRGMQYTVAYKLRPGACSSAGLRVPDPDYPLPPGNFS